MKKKVYEFINTNSYFVKFIYTLIILNVISLILASYKEINYEYHPILEGFEVFSVIIFSIEYILRLWSATHEYETGTDLGKRMRFVFSFPGMIDLLAVLPFYLPLLIPFDLRVLRILRLFRLLRIFKLGRVSKSLQTVFSVLRESRAELSITLFVAFILMVLSSTLMFYVEHEVQPDKFENIGMSMWWAVATLTTVGYGDVYPVTGAGKLLSSVIALVGIGFVALPTGIISSAFMTKVQEEKSKKAAEDAATLITTCPHCGADISDIKH
ncbi:hypothetical protein MASR1M45_24100 [Candidatus Kapaibacterium sp.]